MDKCYRFAIQILSYNRPEYLNSTLESLMRVVDFDKDKIAVVEQSDEKNKQEECIKICQNYKNIQVYPLFKNLGQRGATNYLYHSGFFNDSLFVMFSDHDNVFFDNLNVYERCLNEYPECFICTGYFSPEHDIENKIDQWIIKSTCRAGHMVLRYDDFIKVMPIDVNAGDCSWYAGLDWSISHWHQNSPGKKRHEFVYCLPGAVEHIGRESTWQGYYNDEVSIEESRELRNLSLYDIIHKYPPRHVYITEKYWYEDKSDDELFDLCGSKDEKLLSQYYFDITDFSTYPDFDYTNILAFNYIWPKYSLSFLEKSISQALKFADKYFLIINLKSYIHNRAPIINIINIVNLCQKFKDRVIIRINTADPTERCQQNNIAFHFEQLIHKYKSSNKINHLILIQSDEIYDDFQIRDFIHWIADVSFSLNTGYITNPICYFNSPNWAISPNEDFKRLSLVQLSKLSDNIKYEDITLEKSPITFHHMSYVLSNDELNEKFRNWGHRNDITSDNFTVFSTKFDKARTDKTLTNLHPIVPETYKSLVYRNDKINNECFLKYLSDFTDELYLKYIGTEFDHTTMDLNANFKDILILSKSDRIFIYNFINNMLPRNPKILVLDSIQNSWICSFISKCCTPTNVYSVIPYNTDLTKEYNFGIRQSLKYKFKLYSGFHKTVSAFPNNYFDLILFSFPYFSDLKPFFIEAWPKVIKYGWVLGTYANSYEIQNGMSTLLTEHDENCPWGLTKFNYYENYSNISNSLEYSDTVGLWLGRINK